jgi:hypothetical protein
MADNKKEPPLIDNDVSGLIDEAISIHNIDLSIDETKRLLKG